VRSLITAIALVPTVTSAQAPAPADSTPRPPAATADSSLSNYLDDLADRTDEAFRLQALSISDAEVDSLVRAWEATGEMPEPANGYVEYERRWRLDTELAGFRYNRVEGVNVIPGAELSVPTPFPLRAFGQVGYGWASEEVTWRGGLRVRFSPGPVDPTLEVAHARDVYSYGSGGIAGNSLNALLLGEDWDDYFLAEGLSATLGVTPGRVGIGLGFRAEDLESLSNATDFSLASGSFRPNPPIDPGESRIAKLKFAFGDEDRGSFAASASGRVSGRALGGDFDYESWRAEIVGRKLLWLGDLLTARLMGGAATGDVPWQGLHLLGGFETLRGYDVNEIPARQFAHARLDYKLGTDLLKWVPFVGRLHLQPGPFFDAAAIFQGQERDGTPVHFADVQYRFSTGIEIRQNLLGVPGGGGQLRLDITRRLDRGHDAWTYRFGFTVGQ
jgi:hypothetical protein